MVGALAISFDSIMVITFIEIGIAVVRNTFPEELAWETKAFPRYMHLLHVAKPVLKVRFSLNYL